MRHSLTNLEDVFTRLLSAFYSILWKKFLSYRLEKNPINTASYSSTVPINQLAETIHKLHVSTIRVVIIIEYNVALVC